MDYIDFSMGKDVVLPETKKEKETKSDLKKMEEELDENGEQKQHVLDDSDLMTGGEV